jgi:hypothetical protein
MADERMALSDTLRNGEEPTEDPRLGTSYGGRCTD